MFVKREITTTMLLMFLIIGTVYSTTFSMENESPSDGLVYTSLELLNLRRYAPAAKPADYDSFPKDIKLRARGKRGGVKVRARKRGSKPPLPTMILGNVRSLPNKIDELLSSTRHFNEYREACLMGFTETWLNSSIPDNVIDIPDFDVVRGDRTAESGKVRGGGVCLYINRRWCTNWTVKDIKCTPDIEYITVGLRPYYLPREFPQIFITVCYIHPRADIATASAYLANHAHAIETSSPDAPIFIMGDFNQCRLNEELPNYEQYIDVATRGDSFLDLCYGNIPKAYASKVCCQLGSSDHKNIHLIPTYKQKLKRTKPVTRERYAWTEDNTEALRACLDCTDWEVLLEGATSLDDQVETITNYINFCVELTIPSKVIKVYPNNKPWFTSELKNLMKQKRIAVSQNDDVLRKDLQKNINQLIVNCKKAQKDKIEKSFRGNDTGAAWKTMQNLTGYNTAKKNVPHGQTKDFVEGLNEYYCRFENKDFRIVNETLMATMQTNVQENNDMGRMYVTEHDVRRVFASLALNKAPGPDNISNKVLRVCRDQLAYVYSQLFQNSLDQGIVPTLWKTSTIIPVPKSNRCTEYKDFRPVSLTCSAMKCLERLVLKRLMSQIGNHLDPLQFAYRKNRGVDDAVLCFLHGVFQHLDVSGNFVRALFVDFSSAFNTITPHLLANKLIEMDVHPLAVLWIHNFLLERPQTVRFGDFKSETKVISIGAPQGCVLSPALFSLYTSEVVSDSETCTIIKYADDMVVTGFLTERKIHEYVSTVTAFTEWCDAHYLHLNASKTKEVVFDFRKKSVQHEPLILHDKEVERVNEFKYLGSTISNTLDWKENTHGLSKKGNQRLYFLRMMKNLHVDKTILTLFYQALIQSILSYNLVCYYGNATQQNRNRLDRVRRAAQRIIGNDLLSVTNLFEQRLLSKTDNIMRDQSHPLNQYYTFNRSGIRLRAPRTNRTRFRQSFVPNSIHTFNQIVKR